MPHLALEIHFIGEAGAWRTLGAVGASGTAVLGVPGAQDALDEDGLAVVVLDTSSTFLLSLLARTSLFGVWPVVRPRPSFFPLLSFFPFPATSLPPSQIREGKMVLILIREEGIF